MTGFNARTPDIPVHQGSVDRDVELALHSLHVDKVAAWITEQFAARGVESILLKGPAIARWLYRDGTPRPYGDADLLVSPDDWTRAQGILESLGFEKELGPMNHPGMGSTEGEAWVRGAENVDLHATIWGADVSPERVWATLAAATEPIEVSRRTLRMLSPEARALQLGTHAAKHGDGWAVTDLERGLSVLPFELWQRAAALAVKLGAEPAFASGLSLTAAGQDLVCSLGLDDAVSVDAVLRAGRVPMALGLEQLAQTPGIGAKLGVLRAELFPKPAFMRWWTPIAGRAGALGLAAAYGWRLVWVSRHAVPAFRAWRQARRLSR